MSSSAGGIVVFLVLALGLPAATVALARVLSGPGPAARTRTAGAIAAPAPLPAWLPFSTRAFLVALLLVALDVLGLFVVVWAVALHLLDTGYALAELLLFAVLTLAALAYGWARGVSPPSLDR